LDLLDTQGCVPCKRVKVGIAVKEWQVGSDRQCTNQTIDESANGLAATAAQPIDHGGLIIVFGPYWNECCACDESAEIAPVRLVPGSS